MQKTALVVAIVVVGYGVLQATGRAEPVASTSLSGHGASATSSGAFTKPPAAAVSATTAGWGQSSPLSGGRAHLAARPAAAEHQGNNQAAGITSVIALSELAIAALNPLSLMGRPRPTVSAAWGFNQPVRVNRGVGSLQE